MEQTKENLRIFTGIKDLDLLILEKLDDRSVLNFLATNKNLYTEGNIVFIFGKRYPELVKFLRRDEGLKSLYLRMLKYIGLLREEFGIVYTKEEKRNPILSYAFKKYRIENENMNELLFQASRFGNLEVVRTSLEAGANIKSAPYGLPGGPLIFASQNGHLPVVQYLVENGANIHAADDLALRWASMSGHLPVVQYLVEKGADIHANNDFALKFAIVNRHSEIVKYLRGLESK